MDGVESFAGMEPVQPEIPDKLFFRIGEVSQLVGVEPHVLRYWESEFRGLAPRKSSSGQRMFRRKDVELLLRIRHLLYDRKFTIEGARLVLQESAGENGRRMRELRQEELFTAETPIAGIRRELADILKILL
jgi:DNA-binding transcriptional MerR regulator